METREKKRPAYYFRLKLYEAKTRYRDPNRVAELALARLEAKDFAGAEPLARECLMLREGMIPDDWRTFNARSLLGGSLLGQKKYAEAEPLLLAACDGLKQRESKALAAPRKLRLQQTLERLAELYENTGRSALAANRREEIAGLVQAAK